MALKPGQEKCINMLDRSIVVAAGAGSGKTFTLTKRIVHALSSGAVDDIGRVCAITFTNKAAGELKARIKAELRACGLMEQALKVDEAWISTIHGMCARILRAHAVELDLDPSFKMGDAPEVERLKEQAIDDELAAARLGDGASAAVSAAEVDALFAEYSATTRGLRGTSVASMLRALMDAAGANARGFDAFAWADGTANPAALASAVLDCYGALVEATSGQKPNEARAAWAAATGEYLESAREAMMAGGTDDPVRMIRLLDGLPKPKRTGTADYKDRAAEALELYALCVMELRLAAAACHRDALLELARGAYGRFAAAKRQAGILDNDDLLVMASAAVSDHPAIAGLYADRFQLVMVDEFQDTDQMQVDMIKRLAGPGACRLCTVGDAQQSIYRFRGADVSVYRRHLNAVRAGNPEDVILLPDNFRSHADVLALVDRVFEQPDMFGGEFMSLAPGRDESRVRAPLAANVPRVQVQLTTNEYRGPGADQVRQMAADRIADAFADLRSRGHSAGEMAVLLGGMAHADVYAAALRERGLACVIAGGSVFSGTVEAQMVRDLAQVLANPHQTRALYNVLTGPLFALGADDLLDLCTARDGEGRPVRRNLARGLLALHRSLCDGAVPDGCSAQLQLAARVMGDALEGAGRIGVARSMNRVFADSGLAGRLQLDGAEGLASAANVYKAIRMVAGVERSSAAGPATVASEFGALLDSSKEAPGALSASGGDFVRIMTVHASKGLEFPIVAVGEFKEPRASAAKLLVSDVGDRIYLSLDLQNTVAQLDGSAKLANLGGLYASLMEGRVDEDDLLAAIEDADGPLALRAALFERDRRGDDEESKRLLYVALTRAKEALVVSLRGRRTKDNPLGVPKSCLGAVVSALAGPGGAFEEGVSRFAFGGSAPALVEHVALVPDDGGVEEGAGEAVGALLPVAEPAAAPGGAVWDRARDFAIPAYVPAPVIGRSPRSAAHRGVFSYSSVSDASHEGTLLDDLACAFCTGVQGAAEEASPGGAEGGVPVPEGGSGASLTAFPDVPDAAVPDDEWAFATGPAADVDKATDLGTAFHRLAQYSVLARCGAGSLEPLPEGRVAALARAGNLDAVQRARLAQALDRWFGSEVVGNMAAFADLRAEVPFFVEVPLGAESGTDGAGGRAYLEGEIDLLALDGKQAHVVDYKTGGRTGETADDLARKHVLQAGCYAYALLLQGFEQVDAAFVRVEQPRADDPAQPQCVRYRFGSGDLPALERAIADAYRLANPHA